MSGETKDKETNREMYSIILDAMELEDRKEWVNGY